MIPKGCILLDSQSNVDVVCDEDLLENVQAVEHGINIHCNAGTRYTNQQGYLPGYGVVWFCVEGIANILSLRNVKRRWRVTYDSLDGRGFVVTKEDGSVQEYRESENGLHYTDTGATVLVNTVEENKARYTNAA